MHTLSPGHPACQPRGQKCLEGLHLTSLGWVKAKNIGERCSYGAEAHVEEQNTARCIHRGEPRLAGGVT